MEHNKPVEIKLEPTLADGLAVPMVGYNAFLTARPLIDKMIVVKEEWIALAILRLVEQEKSNHFYNKICNWSIGKRYKYLIDNIILVVVEGAGAAGLAAILAGQLNEFKNKR